MNRRSWVMFGALAAVWGASYLFIKVAIEDVFSPAQVVFVRTALAALVLLPLAARAGALRAVRERAGALSILAAMQVAAPFMLISYGEVHIPSALAGILVAMAPIFTVILAIFISREERAHGLGLVGVALGIGGVVLLLGIDTGGDSQALVGGLMVVVASLGYALGAFFLRRRLANLDPVPTVAGTMAASALMSLPFAALDLPSTSPGIDAVGALFALGVLGTGLAFVLFYSLINDLGPAKASLVAYVAPVFAVAYGVVLLDEDFTAATLAGLVLIVGGSWLAAEGRVPRRRARTGPRGGLAEARAR